MSGKLFKRIQATEKSRKLFQQENTILEMTCMISEIMEKQGINKASLAKKMGLSKSRVTQMLQGNRNLTIRTISDALFAMGYVVDPNCRKSDEPPCKWFKVTNAECHIEDQQSTMNMKINFTDYNKMVG